jgi:tetratricopeptide (TPR) repeat protein
MTRIHKYGIDWCGVIVGLWLAANPRPGLAQNTSWETMTAAAEQAFAQGRYTEAIRDFQAALVLTESYPAEDPRVLSSLMNLAMAYRTQGQYTLAATLYQRALSLQEHLYGEEHPQVLEALDAVIALQRQMHPARSLLPWSAANRLTNRAHRIRMREERAMIAEFPQGWWIDESQIFGDVE